MQSFKDCKYFPFYAIYLYFNKIEFRNYQITAIWIIKITPVELVSMLMGAAIFFYKLSLKIVLCNGALHHTAEAWWGTNRPRLAECYIVMRYESADACTCHMISIPQSLYGLSIDITSFLLLTISLVYIFSRGFKPIIDIHIMCKE